MQGKCLNHPVLSDLTMSFVNEKSQPLFSSSGRCSSTLLSCPSRTWAKQTSGQPLDLTVSRYLSRQQWQMTITCCSVVSNGTQPLHHPGFSRGWTFSGYSKIFSSSLELQGNAYRGRLESFAMLYSAPHYLNYLYLDTMYWKVFISYFSSFCFVLVVVFGLHLVVLSEWQVLALYPGVTPGIIRDHMPWLGFELESYPLQGFTSCIVSSAPYFFGLLTVPS